MMLGSAENRHRPGSLPRSLRSVQHASLGVTEAEVAYHKVREAILHGQIPVGRLLPQTALAKALGMSRTPVRRALQMLLEEGLLEHAQGRQVAVIGLSQRRRHEIV